MNLYDIPLFGMLKGKLDWLGERQKVLAQNIANASTVHYRAKDLSAPSFDDLLHQASDIAKAADEPFNGMAAERAKRQLQAKIINDGEMMPNGNSVILEEQMMKVSQTQAEFQTAIEIYRKGINLLHIALR